jgi:hypothetical protein
MALFCLIVGLLLVTWGIWKGPIFNIKHYLIEDGEDTGRILFFGSVMAFSFGVVVVGISIMFLTGLLPKAH